MQGTQRPVNAKPIGNRKAALSAALAAAVLVAAGPADAQADAGAPPAAGWAMPYVFQHREASATLPLNAPELAGKSFSFTSSATPTLALVVAKQMQAAGLTVVPAGTEGAVNIELEVGVWVAPPKTMPQNFRKIAVAEPMDKELAKARQNAPEADKGTVVAAAGASSGEPGKGVVVPLGGYGTSIGASNVSVGGAMFLVENIGTATGARKAFNGLFGGDEQGICLGRAVYCDLRKGPIGEAEIKGRAIFSDMTIEIFSRQILVQTRNNLGQPLAYAIGDWRDAAMGKPTPLCQSIAKEEKQKTPGCEPVMPSVKVEDFL